MFTLRRVDGSTSSLRARLGELGALVGLSGLAIAQPLLAVFGDAPDVFVFEGAGRTEIVAFALVIAVVPPLALWALVQAGGWGSARRRSLLLSGTCGLLVAVLGAQIGVAAGLAGVVALLLGVLAGAAGAVAHHRWAPVRQWTRWLAVAPVAFVALFLFASPVSDLVSEGSVVAAATPTDPPSIVMVVFDEWPLASIVRRDGSIDADLYPNVADLAEHSTWYRDTTAVANLTNFAVPPLLTGDRPREGTSATAASHPQNLFTLLRSSHRLDVTERITRLCPASLCDVDREDGTEEDSGLAEVALGDSALRELLAEATDVLVDRVTDGEGGEPVTDTFVEPEEPLVLDPDQGEALDDLLAPRPRSLRPFLDGIQAGEEPTLHFLHVLTPHTPHSHLPDGRRYDADPRVRAITPYTDGQRGGDRRLDAEPPALLDRQRLQLEVAHVDRLLGDVLRRLRRVGQFDETLLVVTSDHGLAFRPGGPVRGLGLEPIEAEAQVELLFVPLFVKLPGQAEGVVSDVPAETIDVLPTIAAELGIELPEPVDGDPLPGGADEVDRRFVHVVGSSFATFDLDPPAPVEATLDDVLGLGVDSVLPGRGPDRWWSAGPRPDLVGRPAMAPPLDAELDQPLTAVDLDQTTVPVVISGTVADAPRVAVGVNGRIGAVADTWADEGRRRFAVIVDPDLLRDGPNTVTLHRVR